MKANELMIGDWVQYPATMGNLVPCKVVGISTEITVEFTTGARKYEALKIAQPIPLTKKILKRNGFREDENGNLEYWGDEDDNLWIQVQFDKNKETPICYNIQTPHNGRLLEMVDNVHELQHALKLCGIDKNIEL